MHGYIIRIENNHCDQNSSHMSGRRSRPDRRSPGLEMEMDKNSSGASFDIKPDDAALARPSDSES